MTISSFIEFNWFTTITIEIKGTNFVKVNTRMDTIGNLIDLELPFRRLV